MFQILINFFFDTSLTIITHIFILIMGLRSSALLLFVIGTIVIIFRGRSNHSVTVHHPVSSIKLSQQQKDFPFYTTGKLNKTNLPKVTLLDRLTRKKIDNFIINHYNQYRFEFTFVDLGYASNFMFSFFTQQAQPYKITQKIGFDLNQNILDGSLNLDIVKKHFTLIVRQHIDHDLDQTVTTFNLSLSRSLSNLTANLTHIIRNNQCFTAVRSTNIVSHKCFGGYGSGKVKLDRIVTQNGQRMRKSSVYNPSNNLTRTIYDGLRGSGFHWRWVWGVLSGFSKIQFYALNHTIPKQHWIGLNLGHIDGQGEDFAFIDGQIIPIEGLKYQFNEKIKIGSNITVTAEKPRLKANFTVLQRQQKLQDMGIIKLDMVKLEGNWAGSIQGANGKVYQFYLIAGMLQSFDSLF